ncbi:AbrB family transcriptional regulator [Desulforhopalus vacuolatus]|uniref:AbrB family transcriptional regulator n=1 Tax=Desulforhopalus vacuolatus TaxID=40414 RepID=UPI001964B87F|nr:AbrB family transcriptional regulator [Desulforhopalus vacuolatus]MBM9518876.1 AbrB family transcriptional regulator [Desulforhopalus vacuolatus]
MRKPKTMERYFFIIIAGVIGGMLANRFHIPGGAVVGAMLCSGMTSLLFSGVGISPRVGLAVQIMLGVFLGMTFDRSFFTVAAKALPLAILSTLCLLGISITMAWLASRLGIIDFSTALFGFSPGGMSGMAVLAQTEGHNAALVAFLHMFRVFTLFLVVPLLAKIFMHWRM